MKAMSECGRYEEIKGVEDDLIRNNIDLNTVSKLTKHETIEAIRKALKGGGIFSLNLVGCDRIKNELIKVPDMIGNGNHNEALNSLNNIWEKIKYWGDSSPHYS
jgi:hypothetical protein